MDIGSAPQADPGNVRIDVNVNDIAQKAKDLAFDHRIKGSECEGSYKESEGNYENDIIAMQDVLSKAEFEWETSLNNSHAVSENASNDWHSCRKLSALPVIKEEESEPEPLDAVPDMGHLLNADVLVKGETGCCAQDELLDIGSASNLCDSMQVLCKEAHKAFSSCSEFEHQLKGFSQRLDIIEQDFKIRLADVKGQVRHEVQQCLERESEHFRNVHSVVGRMIAQERKLQEDRYEKIRRSIKEIRNEALNFAKERDSASRHHIREAVAAEVGAFIELTNDRIVEVQHDVEALRGHCATSSSNGRLRRHWSSCADDIGVLRPTTSEFFAESNLGLRPTTSDFFGRRHRSSSADDIFGRRHHSPMSGSLVDEHGLSEGAPASKPEGADATDGDSPLRIILPCSARSSYQLDEGKEMTDRSIPEYCMYHGIMLTAGDMLSRSCSRPGPRASKATLPKGAAKADVIDIISLDDVPMECTV